jgi:hypothetical protein
VAPDIADTLKVIARRGGRTRAGLLRWLAVQCAEDHERRQRAALPELTDSVPAAAGTTT